MRQMQQDLLITYWALRPSAYPSVTQSVDIDRAPHVCACVCVCVCVCAGASPNRRDYGRRLCAEEWARFCGRHSCADAIAKYIRSTKYFFTKTFLLAKDKWKSEPDLLQLVGPAGSTSAGGQHKATRRDSGGWLQRHLSLKRKKQQPQVSTTNRHT